ncbi:hypothetical protein ACOSP7_027859 [Xanthoceras sorbifolium]
MDSGVCEDQSTKCKDLSPKLAEKADEASNKEAIELSTVAADGTASLEPITPVPNREVADSSFDYDVESISDEEVFESVYNNLLEAIVAKQTEGLLAEIANIECDSDCCQTPPAPRLNGIAETCPGAPMKSSAVSRKIDLGLCRKLEF